MTSIKRMASLRVTTLCMAVLLLTACGSGGVKTYAVSASAGSGGEISPSSATVDSGGTTTFTVTANSGYVISGVMGCGGTLSGNTYTTGPINASCDVAASFVAQYTVTASAGSGGSIAPSSTILDAGSTTTFTVTANKGYVISGVTGCNGTLSGNTYTTATVNANCSIAATFVVPWTWVGGADTANAATVYGARGVTAASNSLGGRVASPWWKDSGGNLWVFGGIGNTSTGSYGVFNDLWEYSPSSGEWTWMSGSSTTFAPGVYGTEGVAAAANVPGARYGSVSWTDSSGNLWLFGGFGYDSTGTEFDLNDLWEYSPSSGEWTWMSGSTTANATGVYGTQGVAAASNVPGARDGSVAWTDAKGNLWLFGGEQQAGTAGSLNDLWEYSPSTREWTWMGGSTTVGAAGVYGREGVAAPSNVPGARVDAISWTDPDGDMWLFGGFGHDAKNTDDRLNDLWRYSPLGGEWTWMSGSNTTAAKGVYGTEGTAAAANVPGAREGARSWMDANGNLWLFGGMGLDSTGAVGYLNDLWEYSPSGGMWTWQRGAVTINATGAYGDKGLGAASSVPGARSGSVTWTDASGNLWLLGGADPSNWFSDIWEYSPQ